MNCQDSSDQNFFLSPCAARIIFVIFRHSHYSFFLHFFCSSFASRALLKNLLPEELYHFSINHAAFHICPFPMGALLFSLRRKYFFAAFFELPMTFFLPRIFFFSLLFIHFWCHVFDIYSPLLQVFQVDSLSIKGRFLHQGRQKKNFTQSSTEKYFDKFPICLVDRRPARVTLQTMSV